VTCFLNFPQEVEQMQDTTKDRAISLKLGFKIKIAKMDFSTFCALELLSSPCLRYSASGVISDLRSSCSISLHSHQRSKIPFSFSYDSFFLFNIPISFLSIYLRHKYFPLTSNLYTPPAAYSQDHYLGDSTYC